MALFRASDNIEFDAFLCHSSKDSRSVKRIHTKLETYSFSLKNGKKRKLRVFHYVTDAPLHTSLEKALFNRISEIKHLVLVGSPSAATSQYVNFEIESYIKLYGTDANIHFAWVDGDLEQSYPASFKAAFPNPVFVDLRITESHWLPWIVWKRYLFNNQVLPLLASLFEVDLDVLLRRDRQRRLIRWIKVTAVLIMATGLFAFFYSQTPSEAWTELVTTEDRTVNRAVVMERAENGEAIRTLSQWNHHFVSDVPDNPRGLVNEFNLSGERTGEYQYQLDAGGEGEIYQYGDSSKWGSLRSDVHSGKVDTILEMASPGLLYGYTKGERCKLEEGMDEEGNILPDSVLKNHNLIVAKISPENFEINAEKIATKLGYDSASTLYSQVYFQVGSVLYSFTYIFNRTKSNSTFNSKKGTLFQVSYDSAKSWKNASIIPDLDPNDIVAVCAAGDNANTLYVAFSAVPENPIPNAILRTDDSGVNWKKIPLPKEAGDLNGWEGLMEDMATSASNKDHLVISLRDNRNGKIERWILFSANAGKNWKTIVEGMPFGINMTLGGIDKNGSVVGIFDSRLYLWHSLGFRSRFRLIFSPLRKPEIVNKN